MVLMEFVVVVCVYVWGVGLTARRGLSARVQGGHYRPEVESDRKNISLELVSEGGGWALFQLA